MSFVKKIIRKGKKHIIKKRVKPYLKYQMKLIKKGHLMISFNSNSGPSIDTTN
jgi:hypothetical protein